ncbi:thiamine pyrophosphate-dependent dehydrogenase E1 component subunit alpha [Salinibacterium soli]|uniref:Thiamine pyrophosphate-dependent dehydrogenase E1 component subunit alpha n=1 Tax=Antiquaquibacter soli TaxID=3064523 RepID=A0ABT9BP56_9MICO|nr:thiamine pyrophosphate-dependent dehydrogenase E1 component subunit alpha [Protaetiibacter sp. WY-16]MDO7881576.1 thiamine pyrophosphate-dependent dehydrogenase E1 component subunit alpha [Protaetiibacter sp. WY-16]
MTEATLATSASSVERRADLRAGAVQRFERIVEIRGFEERLNVLFASGAIHGTTHLALGQEALAVGLATELEPTDLVTGTYRGHALALALGMSPRAVLSEIMGKAEAPTGGLGGSMHLCDMAIGLLPTFAIVGAGLPVSVGAGLAFQYRQERHVSVALFGDGSTNIGAFHESMNLAAIWKLPVVFVCDNNVYGEYSRINLTTPIEDLHLRAASYAMPSAVVDGMDVPAVRTAVAEAVERARSGGGPTFIEAKTYRFAGHSRADTAPYRPAGELEHWQQRDPVLLARRALEAEGILDAAAIADLESRVGAALDETIETVRELPEPALATMFDNIWTPGEGAAR